MKRFILLALVVITGMASGCATANLTIEQPMDRHAKPSFKITLGN